MPWRNARWKPGYVTLETYAHDRIEKDGPRVWLELKGQQGRIAIAELGVINGAVVVLADPSEPPPQRRYKPDGRRSAAILPCKR